MKSLGVYINSLRDKFKKYEENLSILSSEIEENYDPGKRNIKKIF